VQIKLIDMRGKSGFPSDSNGVCFEVKIRDRYVIRTDSANRGWRIDKVDVFGMKEAVYGPGGEAYWQDVAGALAVLHDIVFATSAGVTDFNEN